MLTGYSLTWVKARLIGTIGRFTSKVPSWAKLNTDTSSEQQQNVHAYTKPLDVNVQILGMFRLQLCNSDIFFIIT